MGLFSLLPVGLYLVLLSASQNAAALTSLEQAEIQKLIHWMPGFACQDHKALKACILWSSEVCEAQVEKSMSSCLKLHAARIKLPGPSLTSWKSRIVECTEKDVQIKMKTQIVKSVHCQNKGVRGS